MSTRGAIAIPQGDGWIGKYQHSDSYPTGLGKTIWDMLHSDMSEHRAHDEEMVKQFPRLEQEYHLENYKQRTLEELVDFVFEHKSGWSYFPVRCYCHWEGRDDPEYTIDGTKCGQPGDYPCDQRDEHDGDAGCYPLHIEWVYVLSVESNTMTVLGHYDTDLPMVRGNNGDKEGYTSTAFAHHVAAVVDLNGEEPDWRTIESDFEAWCMTQPAYAQYAEKD